MASALTTRQAAQLAGMSLETFRSTMAYARKLGVDLKLPGPDARTPLWDEARLRQYLAARPGKGRWLSKPNAPAALGLVRR